MSENTVSRPKPLFSKTIRPNGRLYYLDVYEGKTGYRYLSICENRKDKEGNFVRVRIFLSPEAVPEMRDALDEANEFLEGFTPTASET